MSSSLSYVQTAEICNEKYWCIENQRAEELRTVVSGLHEEFRAMRFSMSQNRADNLHDLEIQVSSSSLLGVQQMKTEEPNMWTPSPAAGNSPSVNPDQDPPDRANLSQQKFDRLTVRILQRMAPVISPTHSPLGSKRSALQNKLQALARASRTPMGGNPPDDGNDSESFSNSDVNQGRRRRDTSSKSEEEIPKVDQDMFSSFTRMKGRRTAGEAVLKPSADDFCTLMSYRYYSITKPYQYNRIRQSRQSIKTI